MDEFDSKIIRMRQDIDLIKNEINGIQKKTKECKGNFQKSINSLSFNPPSITNHHQAYQLSHRYAPTQLRKTALIPEASNDTSGSSHLNQTERILQEIADIFNSDNQALSMEDMLKEIKLNKQKEDLANLVSLQFNSGKRDLKKSFACVTMFMNDTVENEDKCQEEILLYQSICQELMKRNQRKVNQNKLRSFLKKIYMVENEIKKYQDVNANSNPNNNANANDVDNADYDEDNNGQ